MTNRTIYNPWVHADNLGVPIEWGDPGGNRLGLWTGDKIILSPAQSDRSATSTLSHEIVHVEYCDEPTPDLVWSARREARCDRLAAERLISPHDLVDIAACTDDIGQWALELGVTGWILEAYLKENSSWLI